MWRGSKLKRMYSHSLKSASNISVEEHSTYCTCARDIFLTLSDARSNRGPAAAESMVSPAFKQVVAGGALAAAGSFQFRCPATTFAFHASTPGFAARRLLRVVREEGQGVTQAGGAPSPGYKLRFYFCLGEVRPPPTLGCRGFRPPPLQTETETEGGSGTYHSFCVQTNTQRGVTDWVFFRNG